MKRSRASGWTAILGITAGVALTGAAAEDPMAIVAPLPPGAYPVGCSNVEQDFSRVQAGETAQQYWEGYPSGNQERYVAQLLADPGNVLRAGITIPDDRELFVDRATSVVEYDFLVCYPTGAGNPRFADVNIENLSDALYAIVHFPTYVEMQSIRALSTTAALDVLQADPR